MSEEMKAAVASGARVFLAAFQAAYLAAGVAIIPPDTETLRLAGSAGLSAVLLTVVNWLRAGEPRFGRGRRER